MKKERLTFEQVINKVKASYPFLKDIDIDEGVSEETDDKIIVSFTVPKKEKVYRFIYDKRYGTLSESVWYFKTQSASSYIFTYKDKWFKVLR